MKIEDYLKGIKNNDTTVLGKAITLIESSLEKDKEKALKILDKCILYSGQAIRIGISGTPGVGKSTFIEKLGIHLAKKHKIAILAIDPSSSISKGSILGDKTRMEKLARLKSVFIRPSPSRGTLGGVCNNTRDSITLCEAAGFDIIMIETVGVGQSESIVESMTDFLIYLTLAENGDQLQFIKKGVLEVSDVILINKYDQNNNKADNAKILLEQTIHNLNYRKKQAIFTCSSLTGFNIDNIWTYIKGIYDEKNKKGLIQKKRKNQDFFWLQQIISQEFQNILSKNKFLKKELSNVKKSTIKNPKKIALKIIEKMIKEGF